MSNNIKITNKSREKEIVFYESWNKSNYMDKLQINTSYLINNIINVRYKNAKY